MAVAATLLCALLATPETFAQTQRDRAFTDPAIPVVVGAYTKLTAHPGVFTTRGELEDLAKRINISGSYSAMRFNKLAAQVGRDLSGQKEWGVAYFGCNSDVYNYGFSYEFQTTHGPSTSISDVIHPTTYSRLETMSSTGVAPSGQSHLYRYREHAIQAAENH